MPYHNLTVGTAVVVTETFDWLSLDGATSIAFRVTAILLDIKSGKLASIPITSPIDLDWAADWLPLREPNLEYARALTLERRDTPVLGVWMPDQTVLLIDGTHRYLRRVNDRLKEIDWHVVTDPDWRRYAVIDGPLAAPTPCPFA